MKLLQALGEQIQRDSLPWMRDLVEPYVMPPPAPLTDTVPPEALGDEDSQFATIAGFKLHFKVYNADASPDAPTLLMLHGFNGSVCNWRQVAEGLTETSIRPRVVAFDRPPFGLSERPTEWDEDGPHPYNDGHELALALMDHLGIPQAVVVGHSAGASVAMQMAEAAPERVSGLVLVAPAVPVTESSFARSGLGNTLRLLYMRQLLATDGPGLNYVRTMIERRKKEVKQGKLGIRYDEEGLGVPEEDKESYLKPLRADDWDKGVLMNFRSYAPFPVPDFDALDKAVLVIQGEADEVTPTPMVKSLVERLKARPSGVCDYVEIQRCAHVPIQEHPGIVVDAVLDFLVGSAALERATRESMEDERDEALVEDVTVEVNA